MTQKTSPNSLLLNLWRRYNKPNSRLSSHKKVISTRATPKTVKKIRNVNVLVEVDSRRQAESILKMKTFHTTKSRAYLHEKLNTSKRVISSKKLALAIEEEIASALGKHKYKKNLP